MNLKEVSALLGWKREAVITAITNGVELPKTRERINLLANPVDSDYDIADEDLDDFILSFESEEPGRHPPISIRRELLVETNHRCAICTDSAPLQFHHIVEFSKLKHHDASNMLAICGTCHTKINIGEIDIQSQRMYKDRLHRNSLAFRLKIPYNDLFPDDSTPIRLSWYEIREVIELLHDSLSLFSAELSSKYDFGIVDIKEKNRLNKLGADYFAMIRDYHEPYFGNVNGFLTNPINREISDKYHEIVDEIRSIIAARRSDFDKFEGVLIRIRQSATQSQELKNKGKALNILLSFMYFQCDIGLKT